MSKRGGENSAVTRGQERENTAQQQSKQLSISVNPDLQNSFYPKHTQ